MVLDSFTIPDGALPPGVDRSKFNSVIVPARDIPLHPRSAEWGYDVYKDIFCMEFDEYAVNDLGLLKPCLCDFRLPPA